MNLRFYTSVHAHIDRWEKKNLIDAGMARALREEAQEQKSFGLGALLASLGGVLISAAIITLIAANWEAIPRLMRVGLILSLIWGGYLGGAWLQNKGSKPLAEVFYLVAGVSFGAGIALIGQMYHISGDTISAILIWFSGVFVSSLILRSSLQAGAASAIAAFYLYTAVLDSNLAGNNYIWITPLLIALCGFAGWWAGSRLAAHLAFLLGICYFLVLYFDLDRVSVLFVSGALGLVFYLADAFFPAIVERRTRFSEPIGAYGLFLLLASIGTLQFENLIERNDSLMIFGIAIIAIAVGAIVLSGMRNAFARRVAYLAFSIEVLILALETIGTLLSTSGLFFGLGIIVLALGALVLRLEKRLAKPAAGDAA
ncbi:DUF2157 domain-containing protein [Limoniibacter endophyticus]|uniref:DUF2157 domain-containing protein n=1 Tax=Limoniibacter endophyticus TaxID=1565040 RepID=A0A8J3DGF7_9HYPH|nr:DUF2157 domain-containing protein [Limoniibacter endophyticus]GHC67577.1 hypothetical protein GCM10010136_11740 [Limoniibacter endophyticus]